MGIKKIVLLVLVAALAIAAAESATAHSYYYPQSSMMQAMQNPYGYSPGAYYQNTPSYHALPFFSMGFYNNSAASRGYMMQKQYPQRTYYPSPRAYNYGTSSSSNPQTLNVSISNFSFSPQTLTVHVGDAVIWKNNDNALHSVTSDSGRELSSGNLYPGASYSHVFLQTGTYYYHCSIHPEMRAKIIVV